MLRHSTTQTRTAVRLLALLLGCVLAVAGLTVLWGCTSSGGSNGGSGGGSGNDTPTAVDNGGSKVDNGLAGTDNGSSKGTYENGGSKGNSGSSSNSSGSKSGSNSGSNSGGKSNGSNSGNSGNTGSNSGSNSSGSNGSSNSGSSGSNTGNQPSQVRVTESGHYTSKDEVALYIHTYGHLPSNYITKSEARDAGWNSSKGNLAEACPGMSIGGNRYYDDEKQLPEKTGRTWTECDINYVSGYRGSERIVFSNDGLIFYTRDHYKTFERLY